MATVEPRLAREATPSRHRGRLLIYICPVNGGSGFRGTFLDATTYLYKRSYPSIRWSVRPLVRPSVRLSLVSFERSIWPFLREKSNDNLMNDTMSNGVVASDVLSLSILAFQTKQQKRKKSVKTEARF